MLRQCLLLLAPAMLFLAPSDAPLPPAVRPDPDSKRPIKALDTVFVEEMTWMEVRDALRGGKDTVIIATGGVEQNGPYLATGKHNIILRATTERTARLLGDALVGTIVPYVPEGDIEPPSLHMKYPGTISLSEDVYRAMLTDICRSFKVHGFRHIVLIGDSGGNQDGMKAVAASLNEAWSKEKTRAYFIPEYYDYAGVNKWLTEQGITQSDEGIHDDFAITSQMMVVDPQSVRMAQRIEAGNFRINGVDLAPAEKTIAWGKKVVDYRAGLTAELIKKARQK